MKVLLDTNVVITYLSGRKDQYSDECDEIFRLIGEDALTACIALHSLSIIWYISRKAPESQRREYIRVICRLLQIAWADNEQVSQAVDKVDFSDFEDALQDCCAQSVEADYIITANIKDFAGHSVVPAVTPTDFLRLLNHDA